MNSTNLDKSQQYRALVNLFRQQKFSDPSLHNPYSIPDCDFPYEVLNPWNLWHGNIEADIMLIGQDWGDVSYFKSNFNTDWKNEQNSPTNKNLRLLFSSLGCDIGLPSPFLSPSLRYLPLFFTNTILGIKQGETNKKNMALATKKVWYEEMGVYLVALINIIRPKNIIVMGRDAYNSLQFVYKLPEYKKADDIIANNGNHPLINGAKLFAVAHCSPLGIANRSLDTQRKDWVKINDLIIGKISAL